MNTNEHAIYQCFCMLDMIIFGRFVHIACKCEPISVLTMAVQPVFLHQTVESARNHVEIIVKCRIASYSSFATFEFGRFRPFRPAFALQCVFLAIKCVCQSRPIVTTVLHKLQLQTGRITTQVTANTFN